MRESLATGHDVEPRYRDRFNIGEETEWNMTR